MARYIDADELRKRLLALSQDWMKSDEPDIASGVDGAIIELDSMPTADAVPNDYHDRCMEQELDRRFAAEARARVYPHVINAIREELVNAIGLVERMQGLSLAQKPSDKSDECKHCKHADINGLCTCFDHRPCEQ